MTYERESMWYGTKHPKKQPVSARGALRGFKKGDLLKSPKLYLGGNKPVGGERGVIVKVGKKLPSGGQVARIRWGKGKHARDEWIQVSDIAFRYEYRGHKRTKTRGSR